MMPQEQDRDILVLFFLSFRRFCEATASHSGVPLLKTVTNKMLAEDSSKGFNLDEIVLNYEIINGMPH